MKGNSCQLIFAKKVNVLKTAVKEYHEGARVLLRGGSNATDSKSSRRKVLK